MSEVLETSQNLHNWKLRRLSRLQWWLTNSSLFTCRHMKMKHDINNYNLPTANLKLTVFSLTANGYMKDCLRLCSYPKFITQRLQDWLLLRQIIGNTEGLHAVVVAIKHKNPRRVYTQAWAGVLSLTLIHLLCLLKSQTFWQSFLRCNLLATVSRLVIALMGP